MVIDGQRALALRCPSCGRMQLHSFSLFDFSGRRTRRFACRCGFNQAIMAWRKSMVTLHVTCLSCDEMHLLRFSRDVFWTDDSLSLFCPVFDVEIGITGSYRGVQAAAGNDVGELGSVLDKEDGDQYFRNPTVMHETLSTLQTISEIGNLYCECGNDNIDVDIYPEKIELLCSQCGSTVLVYAENEEDLSVIQGLKQVEMPKSGFTCIDARVNSRRTRG